MSPTLIRRLLSLAVLAVAVPYVLGQVRRPSRRVGRLFLWVMNRSHGALTDWALGHVVVAADARILDVGCGGGATVRKLAARAPEGHVDGVDVSRGSVDAAVAVNADGIRAGRVAIQEAPVSRLPFPDGAFDLVTAVETHYYWPDLPNDAREILRVLEPGGTLLVVAETYRGSRKDLVERPAMKLLRAAYLTLDEHRAWLTAAGFSEVQVFEERGRGWMCATGRRPS